MISLSKKLTIISISLVFILVGCQEQSSGESNDASGAAELEEIVGIEPGSGTMDIAQQTVDGYDLGVELMSSSEAAMLADMEGAIEEEEPIVVTLWQPHWAFNEYDLKFLDDPKETMGASERIHTMVRKGLILLRTNS